MFPAWPDDEYLILLGQVAYAVSALEGLLMFDRPHMPCEPNIDIEGLGKLAGQTTHGLGQALIKTADQATDPAWAAYLRRGGEALKRIAKERNHILHARPATVDGRQILNRWMPQAFPEGHYFAITTEHLRKVLDLIAIERSAVESLRPPLPRGGLAGCPTSSPSRPIA